MTVRIIDSMGEVVDLTHQQASLALRMMVDDIDSLSIAGTPKDKGDLRKNKLKTVVGLHRAIRWNQKYAEKMEYRQFKNYTTPGTGPHYAENAVRKVVDNDAGYFRKAGLI